MHICRKRQVDAVEVAFLPDNPAVIRRINDLLGVCNNIEIKAISIKAVKMPFPEILERIERYLIDQDILCIFQLDLFIGIDTRRIHQAHKILVVISDVFIREGPVEQGNVIDNNPFVRILFKPGRDVLKCNF